MFKQKEKFGCEVLDVHSYAQWLIQVPVCPQMREKFIVFDFLLKNIFKAVAEDISSVSVASELCPALAKTALVTF